MASTLEFFRNGEKVRQAPASSPLRCVMPQRTMLADMDYEKRPWSAHSKWPEQGPIPTFTNWLAIFGKRVTTLCMSKGAKSEGSLQP